MKFFVFATLVAATSATLMNTGNSAVSRSEDGLGNYAFGYNEDHATGGSFRKEQGGPGYMSGSYGLRDADGRMRTVNYVADALGYRASVSTNEPGTDVKQDPAAADFNLGAAAALVAPAAPVLATKTIAAAPVLSAGIVGHSAVINRYAAPIAAPVLAAPAMTLGSSYSTAINHVSAPVLSAGIVGHSAILANQIAAPVMATKAIAAPVLAAPVALGSSYSTAINHVSAGLAAPVLAAKSIAAPVLAAPIALGNSYSTAINHVSGGLAAPMLSAGIVGHSAIYNRVAAPVLAAPIAAPALATSYSTGISHLSTSPVVAAKNIATLGKYL